MSNVTKMRSHAEEGRKWDHSKSLYMSSTQDNLFSEIVYYG